MSVLSLIIAIIALIIGILAYIKAGGDIKILKQQLNILRDKTATALEKAEKTVRPDEEKKPKQELKK